MKVIVADQPGPPSDLASDPRFTGLFEAARALAQSDEMKAKPRGTLREVVAMFDRWRAQKDTLPHTELAEIILDESGYTEMWQKDRSADAAGRLENLKELVRSMEDFENLQGFLEHISLVMDTDKNESQEAVSIMTLHSAKGLEFDTVFLPGWEEGLLPHQRSLDDQGRAGLEEERRLAHVGLTRARRRALCAPARAASPAWCSSSQNSPSCRSARRRSSGRSCRSRRSPPSPRHAPRAAHRGSATECWMTSFHGYGDLTRRKSWLADERG